MEERINTSLQSGNKTFKIDFQKKRLLGTVSGKTAILQSAAAILSTERFQYLIYSDDYGNELMTKLKKGEDVSKEQAKAFVEEALSIDQRILSVENFSFSYQGDSLSLSMTLLTEEGKVDYQVG